MRYSLRVEQRPHLIVLNSTHEKIRDPIRDVQVVRASGLVAGVVAKLEKIFDIRVPRFEIHAASAFSLASLINCRDGRIQCFQPRYDAVRMTIGPADKRALRANTVVGNADTAGEFREHRDVRILFVNAFQAVLRRIEQKAR